MTLVNGNTAAIVVSAGENIIFQLLVLRKIQIHSIIGECASSLFYLAGITINGANVIQADILASNGVVHVINAVI